ncbi:HAMP domain-containing histidine kinase [Candidatus Microgenomates bacterium]|nr:HAMP domain-containing histidine kinase [Candidatus Microgenomates bacterium]
MKSNPHSKDRLYDRVYDYSRKYISFKHKFTTLLIKLGINSIFGILIYVSINFFKDYQERILIPFSILGAIIISFLIDLTWENSKLRKLKKQEKIYARSFIKLLDDYKLAQKNIKARDEFLSIVSHELKTPLTVMLLKLHNELNNIRSAPLANFSVQQLMEVIKNSEQQIQWLKSIINDLLDVSLITTGKMNLELEDTDFVSLTKQVNSSFSEVLKRGKYKIKLSAPFPVIGKWDKLRLEQAVVNLFSNAIKYGEGKPIEIQIFKKGNNGRFIIKDHGIGMTSGEQKVIFDLFERVQGSEEHKNGLGVGLFITSQIVKMHGGKIKVSSSPAKGTSFIIELPLRK